VGKGTLWAGKADIWLSPRPAGAFMRVPSEEMLVAREMHGMEISNMRDVFDAVDSVADTDSSGGDSDDWIDSD
jgi:hypothetical protein